MKALRLRISQRTALLSWAVTISTLGMFVGVIVPWQKRTFLDNLQSKAHSVAISLREVTAGAAVNEDYSSVIEHCKEMLSADQSLAYLVITKNDGFTLVHDRLGWRSVDGIAKDWRPDRRIPSSGIRYVPLLGQRAFHHSQPFDYSGLQWGWIHVGLSLDSYDQSVANLYRLTAQLGVLCIALSLVASLIYARKLVRPILDLRSIVQRVAQGDLTATAPTGRRDELGDLATSVNGMTAALVRHDQILGSVQFAAQQFLSTADWRAVIPAILSQIGPAAGVCRAYVLEITITTAGQPLATYEHEWRAPHLLPRDYPPSQPRWPDFTQAGRWAQHFRTGGMIATRVTDLPAEEKHLMGDRSVQSLLIVPVLVEGQWWGLLGLDDTKLPRHWRDAERDSLQAAADMLGSAVARQRAQAALLEAKATLEQRVQERTQALQVENRERQQAESALARSLSVINATLESTLDGILVMDREGRVKHYNRRFTEIWGLTPEYLSQGHNRSLFTTASTRLRDPKTFIRTTLALHADPLAESVAVIEFLDGRIVERYTRPQHFDGVSAGRIWCFRDITERQHAEAKITYERDLLQTLMDGLPDTLYFKDRQSRFVRISHSKAVEALDFLRVRHQTTVPSAIPPPWPPHLVSAEALRSWLIGKSDFDVFARDQAQACYDEEQAIIATGEPLIEKIETIPLPNGTQSWRLVSKMAWRDQAGQIIGTYGITKDITVLKEAEGKLAAVHDQLMHASRQAGMAEVATGVLHNVGNVLNSVNVSATLVRETLRTSEVATLGRVATLLREHTDDLDAFLTQDPKGRLIPRFIAELADHLAQEHTLLQNEHEQLARSIEHIKEVVTMQQSYARVSGVHEKVRLADLVSDALQIQMVALTRHGIEVVRDYAPLPPAVIDKHKVLQILVNLIHNAKHALESNPGQRLLTLAIRPTPQQGFQIIVSDNGIGIPEENLTRIFSHGFTTRRNGHGFGLHSGANAAREMGGTLLASSPGPGRGAIFTLELPLVPPHSAR